MRKRRRTYPDPRGMDNGLPQIIRLWMLRALVPLGGSRRFVTRHGWDNDDIALTLGLDVQDHFDEDERPTQNALTALLRATHMDAEANAPMSWKDGGIQAELISNASTLGDRFGYGPAEKDILMFCVLLHSLMELRSVTDYLGKLTTQDVIRTLAILLGHSEADVAKALSAGSPLMTSGLVTLTPRFSADLESRLELVSERFCRRMLLETKDAMHLIRDLVSPGLAPTLNLADYSHVEKDIPLMHSYLKSCLSTRKKGVNIFIYGPPGTGKSELSRVMARSLGCDLFEISVEDEDGDPIQGEQRLRAYRVGQSLLANHRCLLVFDEAEDVFQDGGLFARSTAQARKAWLNRMLELSALPTIWLSNSNNGMDPAFMRRFDMCFRLGIPPEAKRREILTRAAGDYLDASQLAAVARSEHLAPAVVSRSVSVLNDIRDSVAPDEQASNLLHLINNTLESQGLERVTSNSTVLPGYYDPLFMNADVDLANVVAVMQTMEPQQMSARFCLYGPPGTGKTAFGHWLAAQLGKPLIIKRASDLLNKYIGGTEQRIAAAFEGAKSDNAILMLDEVDSFLQDRRDAGRSWEVTMVNELLTQMEAFQGVFIASTNLMEGLDQAAMRRFDFKVKLDYLRPEQGWQLLERLCQELGLPSPEDKLRIVMGSLHALTPGDFAVVARRQRFCPATSADDLVRMLRDEVALKENGQFMKRAIGFM